VPFSYQDNTPPFIISKDPEDTEEKDELTDIKLKVKDLLSGIDFHSARLKIDNINLTDREVDLSRGELTFFLSRSAKKPGTKNIEFQIFQVSKNNVYLLEEITWLIQKIFIF